MTPSLAAATRYLVLHEQYLIAPSKTELAEYKRLDLQFALRGWNVSAVKNFVRKEQQQCTSAHAQ